MLARGDIWPSFCVPGKQNVQHPRGGNVREYRGGEPDAGQHRCVNQSESWDNEALERREDKWAVQIHGDPVQILDGKEESVAVHLRLARAGRHKRPFYRLVAADSRRARDGKFIEILGTYDPLKETGVPTLKSERVLSWLHQGAQPTVTVRTLLRRAGIWKQFETEKAAKRGGAAT